MQSGKRHSCQSLGSELNNILIETQIPTGRIIQMSGIWYRDLCFCLTITSTWGHFSFSACLKEKFTPSVGIFRLIFYFKFFKIQVNTFQECIQSNFVQPNYCSLLTPIPTPLTPPSFNHCRWICYALWKSKARLRHRHLHWFTCWWVMMPLLELFVSAFVLRKGSTHCYFLSLLFFP